MELDIRKMVGKAHCYADNYLADTLSKWHALRKAYADGYKEAFDDTQERAKADSNNGNSGLNLPVVSNSALPKLNVFAANNFDNIAEITKRITTGNLSHHRNTIEGLAKRCSEFIRKHYC